MNGTCLGAFVHPAGAFVAASLSLLVFEAVRAARAWLSHLEEQKVKRA